ncbi:MAG: sulfurtransferase [Betaproteobacteria bacterium]|nr:MAG: sulfurtransferase [Betaproteobacteria bacterium]
MPSPLISTAQLAAMLDDPTLVIVDTRHDLMNHSLGRESYAAAHIPGAIFMSMDDDLAAPKSGSNGRHPLPTAETFAKTLGTKGIGNDSTVVVYDQGSSMFIGRLWWMLKWLGHEKVFALDGGIAQWQKEGRSVDALAVNKTARIFVGKENAAMRMTIDDTAATLGKADRRIIDARAPERYRGEVEPVDPVAGHIPGAFNRPFPTNLRDGVFKPAEELRAEFELLLAGRSPENIIHQCGSGVSALSNMLAMEHSGLHGSKLYAGSWSEWCQHPTRPVAKG